MLNKLLLAGIAGGAFMIVRLFFKYIDKAGKK